MGAGRKFLVCGNWVLNGSKTRINDICTFMSTGKLDPNIELVCGFSSGYLNYACQKLPAFKIGVAAQNFGNECEKYTISETFSNIVKEAGVEWVILGDYELQDQRRSVIRGGTEKAEIVEKILTKGSKAIVCICEEREEIEPEKTEEGMFAQLRALSVKIIPTMWDNLVIVYEPTWAIKCGRLITAEQIQAVHKNLRGWIAENVSAEIAHNIRIIYGGSVTGENYKTLAKRPDIDGFLLHNLDSSMFTIREEGEYLISRIEQKGPLVQYRDGRKEIVFWVMDAEGVVKTGLAIGEAASIYHEVLETREVYKFFDVVHIIRARSGARWTGTRRIELLFSYPSPPQKINRHFNIDPRLCWLDYPLIFYKLCMKKKRFQKKERRRPIVHYN